MKKNILLIVLPNAPFEEIISKEKKAKFSVKIRKEIPLGVLSIASYLRKKHIDLNIKIVDFNIILSEAMEKNVISSLEELKEIFYDALPKEKLKEGWLIGLSAIFNTTYCYLKPVSELCKKLYHDVFVFTGGGLPSNLYKEVLTKNPEIDAVCIGEGEIPILELLETTDQDRYLKGSNCWVVKEDLTHEIIKEFKYIEDLDEIPPLDFELIPYKKYSNHVHNQSDKEVIAAPLMFSRGCPFNCCFCSSHSIHGKKIRYNSLSRIKFDIKRMVDNYQVNTITVWDDNFFVDKKQAIELLKFFRELNLELEFVNGFPVYRIDDDIVKYLKEAGVTVVTLAIESGNARVLKDIIHKPLKLEMVEKAVTCLRKYDMYIKGLFVIGLPGETIEDINITMEFIHKLPINWVDIFIASPVAGSELYDICIENGYIKGEDIENLNFWKGSIETPDFKPEQIQEIQMINILQKDFVQNYDMLHENYSIALKNFQYVIKNNSDNPFAFYYAAICALKLGLNTEYNLYKDKFKEIINTDNSWKEYIDYFNISYDL